MIGDHEKGALNIVYSVRMKNKREREMKGWEAFYGDRWLAKGNRLRQVLWGIDPLGDSDLIPYRSRLQAAIGGKVAHEVGQGGAQCMGILTCMQGVYRPTRGQR